ncbi:MAG: hypothetical protein WBG36_06830 [Ornithinimicrobium sp.]
MKPVMMRRRMLALAAALALSAAACGGQDAESDEAQSNSTEGSSNVTEQEYPDIVAVDLEREDDQTASFSVTVSSPYDTPQRYADGWRVLDQDGEVLGEHSLGHDHASEQPFTRTQSDVTIPEGTTELTVEGRDQENGYGGETVTIEW